MAHVSNVANQSNQRFERSRGSSFCESRRESMSRINQLRLTATHSRVSQPRRQMTAGNVVPVLKKTSAETLSLRITVVDPPPNILWALPARSRRDSKTDLEHQQPHLLRLYSRRRRRFLLSRLSPSRSRSSGASWRTLRICAWAPTPVR